MAKAMSMQAPQEGDESASDETAANPADQAEPAEEGAAGLVKGIHADMTELLGLMQKAKGIDPGDIQHLTGILQDFETFVDDSLSSAPGSKPQPKGPPEVNPGTAPMETGGNPNARPY